MSATPVQVILNPYAGRGRGAKQKAAILAAFARAGLPVDLKETQGVGHAIELAHQARAQGPVTLVAAGGDGTVCEVLNGLAQSTPAGEPVGRLSVIPIGSANDFAEMAGAPRTPDQAAQAIATGAVRSIDLGQATIHSGDSTIQRYFGNNLGFGFEAAVTLESYKIRRLRGLPLYTLAALRALRSCPTPTVRTTWEATDGTLQHHEQPTLMVSIGNSRRTGGGFFLTPHAELDDGYLDGAIAAAVSRWRILWLLPKALYGKHTKDPIVTMFRCRRLSITAAAPMPVHVDGEVISPTAEWVEVDLQPGRLQLVVDDAHTAGARSGQSPRSLL
jgi:diacylglycerol kinase (ATP)